jgi:hypothetical protein
MKRSQLWQSFTAVEKKLQLELSGDRDNSVNSASQGFLVAQGRQQERELMQVVEGSRRLAQQEKQPSKKAKDLMVALCKEGIRKAWDFDPAHQAEADEMAAQMAQGRAPGTDDKYCNAFKRVQR